MRCEQEALCGVQQTECWQLCCCEAQAPLGATALAVPLVVPTPMSASPLPLCRGLVQAVGSRQQAAVALPCSTLLLRFPTS